MSVMTDSSREGKVEGIQVGCETGFDLGQELGFYLGCLEAWTLLSQKFPNKFSARYGSSASSGSILQELKKASKHYGLQYRSLYLTQNKP